MSGERERARQAPPSDATGYPLQLLAETNLSTQPQDAGADRPGSSAPRAACIARGADLPPEAKGSRYHDSTFIEPNVRIWAPL